VPARIGDERVDAPVTREDGLHGGLCGRGIGAVGDDGERADALGHGAQRTLAAPQHGDLPAVLGEALGDGRPDARAATRDDRDATDL